MSPLRRLRIWLAARAMLRAERRADFHGLMAAVQRNRAEAWREILRSLICGEL